jgi:Asp-tRNA(Asn)/Glu-tRNA(Gln) amidotransferase A subunit family amidase
MLGRAEPPENASILYPVVPELLAEPLQLLSKRLGTGELRSQDIVKACLERIGEREDQVQAWAFVDPEIALREAELRDQIRGKGPLQGIPVGVKDIFDTADMPTEYGSPIYQGQRPARDAVAVTRLREAGAVVLGKTVTTEFATWTPARTRNPLSLDRTPGGSSSGSAAAVADFMVPLAIGTQTVGSTIRPASYCGTVGFKPTFGAVPLEGAFPQSPSQDTIGLFAGRMAGLALLVDGMGTGIEFQADPVWRGQRTPRIGLARTPWWDQLDTDAQTAIEQAAGMASAAGAGITEIELPDRFGELLEAQNAVTEYEVARSVRNEFEDSPDQLSEGLRGLAERGLAMDPATYSGALSLRDSCQELLVPAVASYDALLTPAVNGEAPIGLASTGDPTFIRTWSLLGWPAISVPGLAGGHGLPIGVQLVAPVGQDARLLGVARWLEDVLGRSDGPGIP